jgi:hypothetical protein
MVLCSKESADPLLFAAFLNKHTATKQIVFVTNVAALFPCCVTRV